MRVLIALFALLTVTTATATAQGTFSDPDFEYSMSVPEGMVLATPEEQAAALGQPVEAFKNMPRAESPDGNVNHVFRWRDITGRDRRISLFINDGPFPFSAPEQFNEAVTTTMQIAVDTEERLTPPDYKVGMRVEGTRTRSDGAVIRQTDVFLPISGDPPRYALLRMECLDVDWSLMWPDFEGTLKSVDIPQPTAGGGAAPRPGGRRRRGGDATAADGPVVKTEDWDTLEVTGSLVLAVVLLMGLFMGGTGGRNATTAS
jgi:hypothetical protein